MLNPKQTYYLQTMGITPWVLSSPLEQEAGEVEIHVYPALVIMEEKELGEQARVLLNNILTCLGLDEAQIPVYSACSAPWSQIKSACVLAWGEQAVAAGQAAGYEASSLCLMPSLTHLLQHPESKQQVYQQFGRVLTCLKNKADLIKQA